MGDPPTCAAERSLWRKGLRLVAGVDEVGRGPLAGPVAAAAVILPPNARADAPGRAGRPLRASASGRFPWLPSVRDSKQLTSAAREELAPHIWRDALAAAVAFVPVESIDRLGIAEATRQAMLRAIGDLPHRPQHLLIDALRIRACSLPQTPIVDGDALSLSIACASIVAKVARDGLMKEMDGRYPGYGFDHNKGYATPQHLEALWRLGPCNLHRRSFSPVRDMMLWREFQGPVPA